MTIQRSGGVVSAYFNSYLVLQQSGFTNPLTGLYFVLQDQDIGDATSVTYSNFSLTVPNVAGLPEPSLACLLLPLTALALLARRPRVHCVVSTVA